MQILNVPTAEDIIGTKLSLYDLKKIASRLPCEASLSLLAATRALLEKYGYHSRDVHLKLVRAWPKSKMQQRLLAFLETHPSYAATSLQAHSAAALAVMVFGASPRTLADDDFDDVLRLLLGASDRSSQLARAAGGAVTRAAAVNFLSALSFRMTNDASREVVVRYLRLYDDAWRRAMERAPTLAVDLDELISTHLGMSRQRFYAIGSALADFVFSSIDIEEDRMVPVIRYEQLAKTTITREEYDRIVGLLGIDLRGAARLPRTVWDTEEWVGTDARIALSPIVRFEDRDLVLSVRSLRMSVCEGLFWHVHSRVDAETQHALRVFRGHAFEEYVCEITEEALGDGVHRGPLSCATEVPVDLALVAGNTALIVEIAVATPILGSRDTQADSFEQYVVKHILPKLQQLQSQLDALTRCSPADRDLRLGGSTDFVPIVVTLYHPPNSHALLTTELLSIARARGLDIDGVLSRLQIMSVGEWEALLALGSTGELVAVLRRKLDGDPAQAVADYLYLHHRQQIEDGSKERLRREFDRYGAVGASELFGKLDAE